MTSRLVYTLSHAEQHQLRTGWQYACQQLCLNAKQPEIEQMYSMLCASYSQPHRAYHTLQHLAECFYYLDAVKESNAGAGHIAMALWFHDAIYNPEQHNNEQQSAELADTCLSKVQASELSRQKITELIMATYGHQANNIDQQVMIDIDLAILGSTRARFLQYEKQIRAEYYFVPEPIYKVKRREVLHEFYRRERIYLTQYFYQLLESQARYNLAMAIKKES